MDDKATLICEQSVVWSLECNSVKTGLSVDVSGASICSIEQAIWAYNRKI